MRTGFVLRSTVGRFGFVFKVEERIYKKKHNFRFVLCIIKEYYCLRVFGVFQLTKYIS